MFQRKRVGAILLMGGSGNRFGSECPKQFHLLAGQPVYQYALQTLQACGEIDEIVLCCHPDWVAEVQQAAPFATVIPGGSTRQESSWHALKGFQTPPDLVLIHDAVRPFVAKEVLLANLEMAHRQGAADTCIASADTLVHAPNGQTIAAIPERAHYLRGQTPQTFRYDWIVSAHLQAQAKGITNASDDCRLVLEAGYSIGIVRGSEENLKITTINS
ncbi:MAG: 2-C-methyl-D-erythritol 4-phosphate cytidylyltransferase [Chlamydiia bacterium]|nr:2-C-methyl-D-erythritol 4-phosphate cytidylyltransferase [Chlamydiia bacterium]